MSYMYCPSCEQAVGRICWENGQAYMNCNDCGLDMFSTVIQDMDISSDEFISVWNRHYQ